MKPAQSSDDFEQPKTQCPRCLAWVEDFDGFGVLFHLAPDGCGYCSHPSRTGGVCGICGDAEPPTQGEKVATEPPPVEGWKRIRDLMQTPTGKRGS